jgi:hypothetical protein
VIVGIVVLWAGYTAAMYGICLLTNKCVTPKDLVNYKFPSTVTGPATTAGQGQPAPAQSQVAAGSPAGSRVAAGTIRPQP